MKALLSNCVRTQSTGFVLTACRANVTLNLGNPGTGTDKVKGFRRSCFLTRVWFYSTVTGSAPANSGSDSKEETPKPINLDTFLNNIHHRYKVKADKDAQAWATESEAQQKLSRQAQTRHVSVSQSLVDYPTATSTSIRDLSDVEILAQLKEFDENGVRLPLNFLFSSASILAKHGNTPGVRLCQKLMKEHFLEAFEDEIHLDHYLANALWSAKEYEQSMNLFKKLSYDYPVKRRKIFNLVRFSIFRAMDAYPSPEQMGPLRDFVAYCAHWREHTPATHLWQALFQHPVPGAQEEAHKMFTQIPPLRRLVLLKFNSLLLDARKKQETGVLLRMLQLINQLDAPKQDLEHFQGCIYDAVMRIYCANVDVQGAKEVYEMIKSQAGGNRNLLWPETLKRYLSLLSAAKMELPAHPVPSGTHQKPTVKF